MKIRKLGQILGKPAIRPEGTINDVSYELGSIFQLDRDHCLLTASLDEQGGHDLCVGNDGYVFSKIEDIKPENAFPINRPDANHPLKSGKGLSFLAKFPLGGGFLPLEATLDNGDPHPAAGTGFCFSECLTLTHDRCDYLMEPEGDAFVEFIQMKWDGQKIDTDVAELDLSGIGIAGYAGIGFNAIPYEGGMLFPFFTGNAIVVVRFEWNGARWVPVSKSDPFTTEGKNEYEPSIRKVGDTIYVYTRGSRFGRLYISKNAVDFQLSLEKRNLSVPQILNELPDGSLYVATNPGPGMLRNPLEMYPLENGAFGEPVILHDQDGIRTDTGDEVPFVDHAVGFNIILENRRRHIVTYRVCDLKDRSIAPCFKGLEEVVHHGGKPNISKKPWSGLYMLELE